MASPTGRGRLRDPRPDEVPLQNSMESFTEETEPEYDPFKSPGARAVYGAERAGLSPAASPDAEYDDVLESLSPETREALRPKPHGEVSITISVGPPGKRYGGKGDGTEEAPANLREGPEIPGEGYTRGSRFGDGVIGLFGMKKKPRG